MTLKKHCLSSFNKWFKYMLACIAFVFLGIGVATICASADNLVATNPLAKVFESSASVNSNALQKTSKLASTGDSTDTTTRFDGNAAGNSTLYKVQTNFDKESGPTGTKYFSGGQAVAMRVTLNSSLTSTNDSITISLGKLVNLSDVSNISFISLKSEDTNSKEDYFTYSVDTNKGTLTVTPTAAGLAAGLGAGSGAFDIYLTTSATSDQKAPGTYPISVTNGQTNIIDTSVQVYNPVVNNGKVLPTQIFGNNGGTPMPYMYPGTNDQRNFDMNCVAQMAVKNPDGSAATADQANDLAYRYTQNYMVAYASIVIKNVTPTQITWKMNVSLPNKATPSGGDDPTIYEPDKLRIMYKPADSNDFSEFTNATINKSSSDNKNVEYTISDIKQKFQPGDELVVPMAITTSGSEKYARLTSNVTATGNYEGSTTTTDSTQIRNLYYIDQVPGKFVPIVDGYENVMSQAAIANTYPEDNNSITVLEPSSTVNLGNNTPFKDADNKDADVPGFSLAAVQFAAAYDNNWVDGKPAPDYANSQTSKNITSELIEESSFMQNLTAGTTRKFHVTATNTAGSNKNLATLHVLPNLKINFVDSHGTLISDVKPMELQGGKSVSSNLTNFSKARTPVIGESDDGDANSYYFVAKDNKDTDQGVSKNSDLTGLINSHIQTDTGTTGSDQKYTIDSNPFDSTTAINWQDVYNALSADEVINNVNPDSTEPYVNVVLKSNATPSTTVNGTAKFVADDTAETQLHDDVTFKGTVGKAYDLSSDTNIQAAIKAVEAKGYTLKTTPADPTIDADTSKDVVTYVFTKNADTTVNGTAKFVADDTAKTQLHDDVTFKGTVGKAYDLSSDTNIQAAIKAVEAKGYTLKTTPADPTIDADTSKDVVTYVFTKNADTTVNGTARFVADDTAETQLHDDVTFKGTVGKAYDLSGDTNIQAAIKAVEAKGYTLKTTPADPTIDADTSKDVVTYVFTKNADTIVNGTAKFVADDTAKTQLHDDVTFKGTVGKAYDLSSDTNIQAAIKAVEAKGYTLKTTPANPTIDADTSKDVVTYVFSLNSTPIPTPTPINPVNPTPVTPTPTPNDNTNTTTQANTPIAKKGEAVYSLKKIYLYKNNTFSKNERVAGYSRKPRVYRPMFVVTGYSHSKNGRLRYQVRDVNHLTKNKGKKGYITAQWAYVRPVYYQSSHKTLTVINPRGVNAYTNVNLTGKVRNYKQGTVLHVTKFVKHNLTTRYVLSNGQYVTGNRKLVEMGKHKQVRYVKVKKTINRYKTVNLTQRNKRHIKKGTKIKVQRYDFSHADSVNNVGALRYKVAGGYITGNSKFVKAYY